MGIKDKIISLGERSNLNVKKIIANESEIGIVSKDSSSIFIDNYDFYDLKIPIAAYIKKRSFNHL